MYSLSQPLFSRRFLSLASYNKQQIKVLRTWVTHAQTLQKCKTVSNIQSEKDSRYVTKKGTDELILRNL